MLRSCTTTIYRIISISESVGSRAIHNFGPCKVPNTSRLQTAQCDILSCSLAFLISQSLSFHEGLNMQDSTMSWSIRIIASRVLSSKPCVASYVNYCHMWRFIWRVLHDPRFHSLRGLLFMLRRILLYQNLLPRLFSSLALYYAYSGWLHQNSFVRKLIIIRHEPKVVSRTGCTCDHVILTAWRWELDCQ